MTPTFVLEIILETHCGIELGVFIFVGLEIKDRHSKNISDRLSGKLY